MTERRWKTLQFLSFALRSKYYAYPLYIFSLLPLYLLKNLFLKLLRPFSLATLQIYFDLKSDIKIRQVAIRRIMYKAFYKIQFQHMTLR